MSIGFWVLHRLYVGRRNISRNEASEANHGLMEERSTILTSRRSRSWFSIDKEDEV
jgi:hypothetical protein